MKNYLFAAAVALSTTIISCGNNDKVDAIDESLGKPSTEITPESAPAADIDPLANTPEVLLPDSSITNPKFLEKSQPATVPSAATPKPTVASGLNPEHGQPGHRCDIAVGAPLNSAPAAKTNTTAPALAPVTPAATPVATPSIPTSVPAGAKLNPAHGQPGHDCAIPVGAPLKG